MFYSASLRGGPQQAVTPKAGQAQEENLYIKIPAVVTLDWRIIFPPIFHFPEF